MRVGVRGWDNSEHPENESTVVLPFFSCRRGIGATHFLQQIGEAEDEILVIVHVQLGRESLDPMPQACPSRCCWRLVSCMSQTWWSGRKGREGTRVEWEGERKGQISSAWFR